MLEKLSLNSVRPKLLAVRLIPAPDVELSKKLTGSRQNSISYGVISCDFDHALHVALDEATKASPVHVLYVRSMYAGLTRTSDGLTGEVLGILEGADDEIVREGLKAAARTLQDDLQLYTTPGSPGVTFFPHVVTSLGEYLSKESGLPVGDAMAYLIAPPLESVIALDAALKAAHVRLIKHFAPPTQTNRGGAFLAGPLEECQAAAYAFAEAVARVASVPIQALDRKTS